MPATTTFALSGNPYIDGVLGDRKWAVNSFTYSFPANASFYGSPYGNNEPSNGFAQLNASQQATARAALAMYASVANLSFAEITETSVQHADIRAALSNAPSTAWAYFPNTAAEGGDAWFNSTKYTSPTKGNYQYVSFIHELGHALGLEHPHTSGMPADRDSMEYSVMSYRSYIGGSTTSGYTNETWGFAQSLMMYDIAAIQHLYGANFNTNAGNTTYSWSPTTGEMFINGVGQGAPGGNKVFQTVWDGGGTDTYDFSNYTSNLSIDLRPGQWSTISTAQLAKLHYSGSQVADGNIANALLYHGDFRSLIDNAVGGSGSDMITGNDANNTLRGYGGNDSISGGAGSDHILGGVGADTLFGNGGSDTFSFGIDVLADLNASIRDQIDDFNRGNGGSYSFAEGDVLDFTSITSSVYNHGAMAAESLIRIDTNGGSPLLQLDRDGTGAVFGWQTVANLPGIQVGNSYSVALGTGDPIVTLSVGGAVHLRILPFSGDFNGDGRADLFQAAATGQPFMRFLNGGTTLALEALFNPVGWNLRGVGDFNGDGKADLFWRDDNGLPSLWTMNGSAIADSAFLMNPTNSWQVKDVADFNNDGRSDILWESGTLAVIWSMDGATITSGTLLYDPGPGWHIRDTGDFNGDNKSDILWQHDGGQPVIWTMDGPTLVSGTGLFNPGLGWHLQGTGDFDGDGTDDILWRDNNGLPCIWTLNGGTIADSGFLFAPDLTWSVRDIADYNGDGKSDIIWQHSGGLAVLWTMDGYSILSSDLFVPDSFFG